MLEREGEILWVILHSYIIQALRSRGLAKQPAKVSRQHCTLRGFNIHLEIKFIILFRRFGRTARRSQEATLHTFKDLNNISFLFRRFG